MHRPRPRLNLLSMIGLVAVVAVSLCVGIPYLDPDPVRQWQREIRGSDPADVQRAVHDAIDGKVPGLDSDRAVAEFVEMLGGDGQTRSFAAKELVQFGSKAKPALPDLMALLQKDDWPIVQWTVATTIKEILFQLPDNDPIKRATISQLFANLSRPEPSVRVWSAWCLNEIGEQEVSIPILLGAVKDTGLDSTIRSQILMTLTRTKLEPQALDALLSILEAMKVDPGGKMAYDQIAAAWFLHESGRSEAALALLRQIISTVQDLSIKALAEKSLSGIQAKRKSAGSESAP